jgi:hypothetical protein|tara:strand:+ start:1253 stop:1396 length:144 start_codon:yes stop_codon:yes gene_type:complete
MKRYALMIRLRLMALAYPQIAYSNNGFASVKQWNSVSPPGFKVKFLK